MTGVVVRGIGAVSPAGWNVDSLRDALAKGEPLPLTHLPRPGWSQPLPFRAVPPLRIRPGFLAHQRLRRTSPITQFAAAASLEALGPDAERVKEGSLRLGVVVCVMAGCVNYSKRFYQEILDDPATASPLIFPETVFNAPASHIAATLGSSGINYTLVGDSGMFLVGLAMAADWLQDGQVDGCLIVGAEESDWLTADASRRFQRNTIVAEGAGALYLRRREEPAHSILLAAVTDAHSFLQHQSRLEAARAMRSQLSTPKGRTLLCDGLQATASKADAAEARAWADWTGARLSPKCVLGEGMAAASAWQCVAAVDELHQGRHAAALVSVVGCNQQAVGAAFIHDP